MKYSSRTKRTVSKGWQAWRVHEEARRLMNQGQDVILLTIGDPDFETPTPIINAAVDSLQSGRTHYTPLKGEPPLRQAVANFHRELTGQPVDIDHVIIVSGAQCGLFATCMCLLEPDDEVIVLDPTYTTYPYVLGATGASTITVPLRPERGFQLDPADLANAISNRTRAVLLNTPHNPTGSVLHRDVLDDLAELSVKHNFWVISDEVYGTITFEQPHISPTSIASLADRSVAISSLSKSHAMTGWRLGWVIAPTELIDYIGNLLAGVVFGLPPFIQDAALNALTESLDETVEMRKRYKKRRDLVCGALEQISGIHCHRPEGGMYVMIDVRESGLSSYEFAHQLLDTEKVALLPGEGFGQSAAGHLRLSLTAPDDMLLEACERISRFTLR
ncbi:pyridoxal phosphate-dependent aminotransferase [Chloroflexi bacterium TSY]|nr:pyridoxal phosphate-dependent aminotransferase [Chloroflexi bacterium TSY]